MATVTGTVADDFMAGLGTADTLDGLAGDDIISGLQGEDLLYGGRGDDILRGGSGADFLFGGEGSDVLSGIRVLTEDTDDTDQDVARYDRDDTATQGVVVNLALGSARDGYGSFDVLIDIEGAFGGSFADRLTGGNVANNAYEVFAGLGGADSIAGGTGFDELRYDRDAGAGGLGGVIVNLAAGIAIDGFGDTDTISGIERVRGTASADRMIGDALANEFRGLDGADSINGGAGSDWMDYRRDDDYGGVLGVTVNLALGTASDGFGAADTLVAVENVYGTRFLDRITGDVAANRIDGGGGDDIVAAAEGNDSIDGAYGNDRLNGGLGNDRLTGGFGLDTLTGASGRDTFVFEDVISGRDSVTDFLSGQDRFELSVAAFGIAKGHALVTGTDFFALANPLAATGAGASVIYETDAGRLWFDFDGAGGAAPVLLATLTGTPAVAATDFIFA